MADWEQLLEFTMGFRRAIVGMLEGEADRADILPPTWNNNLHWHAGHLVTTPRLLTLGLLGEPLGIPETYRRWFAKGTSPADWAEADAVPSFDELVPVILDQTPALFEQLRPIADKPLANPYTTSVGVTLRTPAEALRFSLVHDGTHMGMIQALRRGLNGMGG